MRASRETKTKLGELAASRGLTESGFLALLVDNVVALNEVADQRTAGVADEAPGCANDRITLRLRPGDRARADAKAAGRCMKTSSYLAMLVRNHVRGSSVMPTAELEELKTMAGHLALLGRQLRLIAAGLPASAPVATMDSLLLDVGTSVESVRNMVAGVVRANLLSWEAADHA